VATRRDAGDLISHIPSRTTAAVTGSRLLLLLLLLMMMMMLVMWLMTLQSESIIYQ